MYGITSEQYSEKLQEQKSVCDICKMPETRIVRVNAKKYKTEKRPRLSVDHDHETGEVRGLLCTKCNIALGHMQDSIEILESAIIYLKKWRFINE